MEQRIGRGLMLLVMAWHIACGPKAPARIDVALADNLNDDHALAVQIAVFRARDVPANLAGRDALRWFEEHGRDLLDKEQGVLHRWEWVPGQTLADGVPLKTLYRPVYLIFAAYRAEGCQAVVMRGAPRFRLVFGKRDFQVFAGRGAADNPDAGRRRLPTSALMRDPATDPMAVSAKPTAEPSVISSQLSPPPRR